MKERILSEVRKQLKQNTDAKAKAALSHFFKEEVNGYGVKMALITKILRETYGKIKGLPKKEIFIMCENLMKAGYFEERIVAFKWAEKQEKYFQKSDFRRLETWVNKYISNWAECDTLCNHTIGAFIERFPQYVEKLKLWAKSENRWVKRAASVSLILPARRGGFLKDVFEIADILCRDTDDMVQKGYGWMLKEASRKHRKEVFDYVIRNKNIMPRTAFRYAIEKMGVRLRRKAMAK